MKLIPDGWRWPRIVTHILDSESTTVTFGFMLFIVASVGAFIIHEGLNHALTSDTWLWCVVLSSILIGGKLVTKSLLEAMELKMGGKPALDALDDAPETKEKTNAPPTGNPTTPA